MSEPHGREEKIFSQKRERKYRAHKTYDNVAHSRKCPQTSKSIRGYPTTVQEGKIYDQGPSGRPHTTQDSALGELATILSQNAQLSTFNQTNMVQANIEAAEVDLKSLEATCTEQISYFLSPSDLRSISLNAERHDSRVDSVKLFLEKLYGKLPKSFSYDKKNETGLKRPPYSGSCFSKANQNLTELKSPPKNWV